MSLSISPVGVYITVTRSGFSRGGAVTSRPATRQSAFADTDFQALSRDIPTDRTVSLALSQLSAKATTLNQLLNAVDIPTGSSTGFLRTVQSSNSTKAVGQALAQATIRSYSLETDRLSSAKTLQSDVLDSSDTTALSADTHSFTMTVDDIDYTVSVEVESGDTNKEVLDQLARAIGSVSSDIDAVVSESERPVYSTLPGNLTEKVAYLSVGTSMSGSSPEFSLADTGSGTIIETLQLDRSVSRGGSARYALEGFSGTTDTDTVSADNGKLSIQLLDTTGERVTLRVEAALGPVVQSVTNTVSAYNNFISWLGNNSDTIDPELQAGLTRELNARALDLQQIGLDVTSGGKIRITDQFASAVNTDISTVRETLLGNDGLFTEIAKPVQDIVTSGAKPYARTYSSSLSIYA